MNKIKVLIIGLLVIGFAFSSVANAKEKVVNEGFKVAVVDVQKIVDNSSAISALKNERSAKIKELAAFVETAKATVDKETVAEKKQALEDKYNKELNIRKDAIDKAYSEKLIAIDKQITLVIKETAKKNGYGLTLIKSNVLDGGDDITDSVIKQLK